MLLTTWWIYWATPIGPPATLIVNGGYMTLTFLIFHHTRRRLGDRLGYASLVIFWLAFEFLYIRAQINFPWLILGNGFANDVMLIQWYEWTGSLGGSLWVLVMNLLVFKLVKGWLAERSIAANRKRHYLGSRSSGGPDPFFRDPGFSPTRKRRIPTKWWCFNPILIPFMKFVDMPQEEQTAYPAAPGRFAGYSRKQTTLWVPRPLSTTTSGNT